MYLFIKVPGRAVGLCRLHAVHPSQLFTSGSPRGPFSRTPGPQDSPSPGAGLAASPRCTFCTSSLCRNQCGSSQVVIQTLHVPSLRSFSRSAVSSSSVTPWTVAHQALCPWDFLGKDTGVGYHFLPQGIFLTWESNLWLLHWQAIFLNHCSSCIAQLWYTHVCICIFNIPLYTHLLNPFIC